LYEQGIIYLFIYLVLPGLLEDPFSSPSTWRLLPAPIKSIMHPVCTHK